MSSKGSILVINTLIEFVQEMARDPLGYCLVVGISICLILMFLCLALIHGLEYLDDDEDSWGPSHGSNLYEAIGSLGIAVLLILILCSTG